MRGLGLSNKPGACNGRAALGKDDSLDDPRARRGTSVEFYRRAFGLSVADRIAFETFTLVYLNSAEAGFELELTVNQGRIEPYIVGGGYGHLAIAVDEIREEHKRLSALGLNPGDITELNRDGKLFALFFFVADPDGYKIEVLQRHGRFQ